MSSIEKNINDIKMNINTVFSVNILRIKIILRDKLTISLCVITLIIFAFLLSTFSIDGANKSRIPIGIVDMDRTNSSKQLINNLGNNRTLYLYNNDYEKLEYLLKDNRIESIYVIPRGYEKNIKQGKTYKLLTVYNMIGKKDNEIISDIVASEFIYEVTLWKSIIKYKEYTGIKDDNSILNYLNYASKKSTFEENNFKFDIEYKNIKANQDVEKEWKNEIIYYQIIMVILGMLIALLEMFFLSNVITEKENEIINRFKTLPSFRKSYYMGNYMALICLNAILCIIFSFLIMITMKVDIKESAFSLIWLLFLYSNVVGGVYLFLTCILKKTISYQLLGVVFILINGVSGFLMLMGKAFPSNLLNILKFTPNSLFIQDFTDIIINGNGQGKILISNQILSVFFSLIIIILLFPFIYDGLIRRGIED